MPVAIKEEVAVAGTVFFVCAAMLNSRSSAVVVLPERVVVKGAVATVPKSVMFPLPKVAS